jgi:hypothetical protein
VQPVVMHPGAVHLQQITERVLAGIDADQRYAVVYKFPSISASRS